MGKPITLDEEKNQPIGLKTIDNYTKEERSLYNRRYKKAKRVSPKYKYIPKTCHENYPVMPLTGTDICCSWFGCGKKLTPMEALYGNTCINHQTAKGRIDPTSY